MGQKFGCSTFSLYFCSRNGKGKTLESGLQPTYMSICEQKLNSVLKFVNPLANSYNGYIFAAELETNTSYNIMEYIVANRDFEEYVQASYANVIQTTEDIEDALTFDGYEQAEKVRKIAQKATGNCWSVISV